MWALLSDPGHANSFDHLGEAYVPLRRLIEQLARREYAGRVYAFQALASFNLTTAPTYQEAAGHDGVGIEYIPDRGSFRVSYSAWAPPARNPRIRTAGSRVCEPQEVGEVIDRYVRRLLQSRQRSEAEPSVVQLVFLLVMLAGLLAFLLFGMLFWVGLPVGPLMVVSGGVALTATGLNFIGGALRPRWVQQGRGNPRPGYAVVLPGRLTSLGVGLWFGAGGVAFLGAGWLTEHGVWAILGAFAAALVLALVGSRYDRRRAEAARAAVRRRGWLLASRREEDDLPADEAHLRQAREEQRRSIQRHLTGRITLERIETRHRYLVDIAGSGGSPKDWSEVAEEWRAFLSACPEGDELWAFNTVSVRLGLASGEEGFALVRDGTVVDWFITAVVG